MTTNGDMALGTSRPEEQRVRHDGSIVWPLSALVRTIDLARATPDDWWQPTLCRLEPGEGPEFRAACERRGVDVLDSLDRQLAELARVKHPRDGDERTRAAFIHDILDRARDHAAVGVWAVLPWKRQAVHLLDRADYFDVITNRNHDKIDALEQATLRKRRVAVVGLSVGGEAAVTIAQEHLCGEIVLADFDRLDLSNMNRLSACCGDLGMRKTTIVARRILELDPFLDVHVFGDGATDDNVAPLLDGVDLLVEECDHLPMKMRLRHEARARRINVIYAADERGFLSVEPYAHHGELLPFHGLDAAAERSRGEFASALEFWRALTSWVGGWDGISARSRASLERVGTTLSGYPQLASEARFAAGQLGHVARRLLLGERLAPFVGSIDLETLLPVVDVSPATSTRRSR